MLAVDARASSRWASPDSAGPVSRPPGPVQRLRTGWIRFENLESLWIHEEDGVLGATEQVAVICQLAEAPADETVGEFFASARNLTILLS